MAYKCGDDTALYQGRLTLNPLAHLDLFGTLCFFIAGFGWAKPVPINPYNFRYPSRDIVLVSVAGVCANFLTAVGLALILRLVVAGYGAEKLWMEAVVGRTNAVHIVLIIIDFGIFINLVLIFFNMIPIPPLDGSHVLEALLPWNLREKYYRSVVSYGPFILIALIFLGRPIGLLSFIIGRPTELLANALVGEKSRVLVMALLRGLS